MATVNIANPIAEQPGLTLGAGSRLASLDALRGFDMFWIIGGAQIFRSLASALPGPATDWLTAQLEHVPWQGLHFYDAIWPLFMFIMGVAMPFSLAKRKASGETTKALYSHALLRAAIFFVLGMIAQGNLLAFDLEHLYPCYSVLHGIGAGYLLATIVMLNAGPYRQAAITGLFLVLYWGLLMVIPVPGYGAGVLTPEGNAAAYVDRLLLGRFHHGLNTWFLSYLGFASSVLLGVLAGEWLMRPVTPKTKLRRLWGAGVVLLGVGLVWSVWFPIIKLLWTSTFVLVTGGLSFFLLALFYWLVEVRGYRRIVFPFVVIGMNALTVYMATSLFDFRHISNILVGGLLPRFGIWGGFVEALAAFAVIWAILYWMFRTRSYVKV